MKKLFSLCLLCLLLCACQNKSYQKDAGEIFRTSYHITYQHPRSLQSGIDKALQGINESLSMFNPNSTLSRINQAGVEAVDLSHDALALHLIGEGLKISRLTEGAFDMTVAPLVNLWGFGFSKSQDATQEAIDAGLSPQEIINGQMIAAMSEIGQRFQDGKAFVPQLLMAARAMKGAMQLLKPLMEGAAVETLGKAIIGTVKGDLHDIGKNLVASMLEGCGFEVINIGIDVPAEKFVEAVKEHNADILAMSALLTTTMPYMKEVIDALEVAGIRQSVKVMVGGAPLSQEYADEIGADGYSDNANSAVALAKSLMGKN